MHYRIVVYPAPFFSATPSTGLSAAFAAGTCPSLLMSMVCCLASPLKPTYHIAERRLVVASDWGG